MLGRIGFEDTSELIEKILCDSNSIVALVAPPQTGKTTIIEMIKEYTSQHLDEKFSFSLLKINHSEYASKLRGRYRVIHIDFSDMVAKNEDEFLFYLNNKMKNLYEEYRFIYESDLLSGFIKSEFKANLEGKKDEASWFGIRLSGSLIHLMEAITQYNEKLNIEYKYKRPIVLIDNYDKLSDKLNASFFIERFFSEALKSTSQYMAKAILMGRSKSSYLPDNCSQYHVEHYDIYKDFFTNRNASDESLRDNSSSVSRLGFLAPGSVKEDSDDPSPSLKQ